MGTGGYFPGGKAVGREADNSPLVPTSRMRGAIPPIPNTSSWRGALLSTGTTSPLPFYLLCQYPERSRDLHWTTLTTQITPSSYHSFRTDLMCPSSLWFQISTRNHCLQPSYNQAGVPTYLRIHEFKRCCYTTCWEVTLPHPRKWQHCISLQQWHNCPCARRLCSVTMLFGLSVQKTGNWRPCRFSWTSFSMTTSGNMRWANGWLDPLLPPFLLEIPWKYRSWWGYVSISA
jgi:hypothetical protein